MTKKFNLLSIFAIFATVALLSSCIFTTDNSSTEETSEAPKGCTYKFSKLTGTFTQNNSSMIVTASGSTVTAVFSGDNTITATGDSTVVTITTSAATGSVTLVNNGQAWSVSGTNSISSSISDDDAKSLAEAYAGCLTFTSIKVVFSTSGTATLSMSGQAPSSCTYTVNGSTCSMVESDGSTTTFTTTDDWATMKTTVPNDDSSFVIVLSKQ